MYEQLKCPSCGEMLQFQPVKVDKMPETKDGKEMTTEEAEKMPLNELRDKLPKKED